MEMSFPEEDRAGYNSIHRSQESQRAFLKLESCGVRSEGEIVEAKSLAQPDLAELPVDRVGVGKRSALAGNGDGHLLLGNGERELQLGRALQIHGLDQRLETIPRHPEGIGSGGHIGRPKFAPSVTSL